MILLMSGGLTIAASAVVFLLITLILVGALLFAKENGCNVTQSELILIVSVPINPKL